MTLEQYEFKEGDKVKFTKGDFRGCTGIIIGVALRGDNLRYNVKINNKVGELAAASSLMRVNGQGRKCSKN